MKKLLFKNIIPKNIIPVTLMIINLGLVALVVLSFRQSVNRNSELGILKNKIVDLKTAKKIVRDFKEAQIIDEEGVLKKKLPLDSVIPLEVMKEVTRIGGKLEIQEINISFKKESRKASPDFPNVEILPLEVKLSCGYDKITNFLKEIAKSPYLINAVDLKISRDPKKLSLLNATLTLDTYTILSKKETPQQTPSTRGEESPMFDFPIRRRGP